MEFTTDVVICPGEQVQLETLIATQVASLVFLKMTSHVRRCFIFLCLLMGLSPDPSHSGGGVSKSPVRSAASLDLYKLLTSVF